jgi:trehalose 6-phosphate phosphatase
VLEQFAWSNVLLAFDYDGTLAPIVADPGHAQMRQSTRRLLAEVARLYPCVVISGRARADVSGWLRGIGVLEVIGNHGAETSRSARHFARQVERWLPLLEARLAGHRGVWIENKVFSVAVHYRQSREKRKARLAVLETARSLGDVRVIPGKLVVDILPVGAPHKGMALEAARERLGCDTAIYVGDDGTDEDVFALQEPGRLLAIRVGARRDSLASYCIPGQAQVDELLRALIAVRRPSGRRQLGAR